MGFNYPARWSPAGESKCVCSDSKGGNGENKITYQHHNYAAIKLRNSAAWIKGTFGTVMRATTSQPPA